MPYSNEFKKLLETTRKTYLGKEVKPKYRKRYGKKYQKGEIKAVAYAMAKSRGIKIDK